MRNQFVYTRKVEGIDFKESFNVNKAIRGRWLSPNVYMVILDDGHEQTYAQQKPVGTKGKTEDIRVREFLQSRIELDREDAERFLNLTNIEGLVVKIHEPFVSLAKDTSGGITDQEAPIQA